MHLGLVMECDYDKAMMTRNGPGWTSWGCTAHLWARGEVAHALQHEAGCKAWQWVVERTQSWMHRSRRVRVRWGKKCVTTWDFGI